MDRKTELVRGIIAIMAVILVLVFVFLPLHEDWIRENNRGRKKLEISAGENYTWSFPVQDDGVSSLEISFSGMKNVQDLIISVSLLDEKGRVAASERKKTSEVEKEDNSITQTSRAPSKGQDSKPVEPRPGQAIARHPVPNLHRRR